MVVIVLVQLLIVAFIIYAVFDIAVPIFMGKPAFSIIKSLTKKKETDDKSKYKNLFDKDSK